MGMLHPSESPRACAEAFPTEQWRNHGLLAAVSGGADSTALLHFLASNFVETPDRLAVAHVNHGLRGAASDEDAEFVQKLASDYGLRYFGHRIEPKDWNADETGSREAAARNIRYDFLIRTAMTLGFRYIATAHTADDQTETVLHRILRGTGLSGLSGILRYRQLNEAVTLVRPLLDVRRTEILDYLESLGKPFRIDATNAENDFTRNRIRNVLIPLLRTEFNPKADAALCRLARLAGENETVLDELTEEMFEAVLLRESTDGAEFDTARLLRFSRPTVREIFLRFWKRKCWPLRDMGLEQWDALVDLLFQGKGGQNFPGGIEARHDGDRFVLRK